jgi:hypothetical protein
VVATADLVTMPRTARGGQPSWARPRTAPGGAVRLRIVADPPPVGQAVLGASCDRLVGLVEDAGEWVELGSVDGAFLSSDFTESFTGRVVGPYAREGVVDVRTIEYAGQDVRR